MEKVFSAIAGIDLHFGNVGLRFSYQWGLTQRMKKGFYEGDSEKSVALRAAYNPNGWTKEMYNPRYNILTVAFIYKFDL